VDRRVAQTVAAQQLDVACADFRGRERQLGGVVAERAGSWVEVCVAVVVLGVVCKLLWSALVTEVVGVRAASVVALVRRRHDRRQ
jgi:hypothetical protein